MKFNNTAEKLALWDKREEGYSLAVGLPHVEKALEDAPRQKSKPGKQTLCDSQAASHTSAASVH